MPVNPNIPLQVRRPEIHRPLDVVAGWQQVRQGEQEQQINAMRMEQAQQQQAAQQQEAQARNIAQEAIGAIRRGDDTTFVLDNLSEDARPGVEEWLTKRKARIQADRADAADMIRRSNYDMAAFELAFGLDDDPDGAREVFEQAKDHPEALRRLVDVYASPQEQPNLTQVDPTKDLINPKTGEIVRAGTPAEEKAPALGSEVDYLTRKAAELGRKPAQVSPRDLQKWRAEYASATRAPQTGGDNEPLQAIVGPDGKPVFVRRSDAIGKTPASGTSKPASGLEKRALNFFNRARQADIDLEAIEPEIQKIGLVGQARMQYAPNVAQTELGQSYTQAQRAFTEARLRKDSGAAIPEQEFKNDRQTYFVQPGDSVATQEQKRRARAAVLASLGFESGQALGEFIGDSDEARTMVEGYKARSAKTDGKKKIGRFEIEVTD